VADPNEVRLSRAGSADSLLPIDALYLRNDANIRVKDHIARLPRCRRDFGVWHGDDAMPFCSTPTMSPSRGLTPATSCARSRSRDLSSPAGQLGAEPQEAPTSFAINAQGPAAFGRPRSSACVVLKTGANGEFVRRPDVAHIDLGASDYN